MASDARSGWGMSPATFHRHFKAVTGLSPLQYQKQIAHAAVDAGADIIMGHGVHAITPIEVYKDKPIFYGLGCFSFNEGHGGRDSTFEAVNWLGLLARVTIEDKQVVKVTCVPVRHNKANETLIRSATDERDGGRTVVQRPERRLLDQAAGRQRSQTN